VASSDNEVSQDDAVTELCKESLEGNVEPCLLTTTSSTSNVAVTSLNNPPLLPLADSTICSSSDKLSLDACLTDTDMLIVSTKDDNNVDKAGESSILEAIDFLQEAASHIPVSPHT